MGIPPSAENPMRHGTDGDGRAGHRLGHHVLVDFYGVAPARLNDVPALTACVMTAAQRCGLTPLASALFHRFPGGGVTGVLVLAESHIALHTFPEHGFMALDVFTCGQADATAALDVFRAALVPQDERITVTARGEYTA